VLHKGSRELTPTAAFDESDHARPRTGASAWPRTRSRRPSHRGDRFDSSSPLALCDRNRGQPQRDDAAVMVGEHRLRFVRELCRGDDLERPGLASAVVDGPGKPLRAPFHWPDPVQVIGNRQ
jgi:hypothetical protein